jgi:hypothetical protein
MIPDYFTNYHHQLESYEAVLSEKLTALLGFVSAVSNDWESIRKKRALMRLDETQVQAYEYLKKLNESTSVSEFIQRLPGDLPTVCNIVWKLIAGDTGDSVSQREIITSSFFQNPEVASILQHTFDKVREEIQTTPIPADTKATVYVDQKFEAELREALRTAFHSPNRSTGPAA